MLSVENPEGSHVLDALPLLSWPAAHATHASRAATLIGPEVADPATGQLLPAALRLIKPPRTISRQIRQLMHMGSLLSSAASDSGSSKYTPRHCGRSVAERGDESMVLGMIESLLTDEITGAEGEESEEPGTFGEPSSSTDGAAAGAHEADEDDLTESSIDAEHHIDSVIAVVESAWHASEGEVEFGSWFRHWSPPPALSRALDTLHWHSEVLGARVSGSLDSILDSCGRFSFATIYGDRPCVAAFSFPKPLDTTVLMPTTVTLHLSRPAPPGLEVRAFLLQSRAQRLAQAQWVGATRVSYMSDESPDQIVVNMQNVRAGAQLAHSTRTADSEGWAGLLLLQMGIGDPNLPVGIFGTDGEAEAAASGAAAVAGIGSEVLAFEVRPWKLSLWGLNLTVLDTGLKRRKRSQGIKSHGNAVGRGAGAASAASAAGAGSGGGASPRGGFGGGNGGVEVAPDPTGGMLPPSSSVNMRAPARVVLQVVADWLACAAAGTTPAVAAETLLLQPRSPSSVHAAAARPRLTRAARSKALGLLARLATVSGSVCVCLRVVQALLRCRSADGPFAPDTGAAGSASAFAGPGSGSESLTAEDLPHASLRQLHEMGRIVALGGGSESGGEEPPEEYQSPMHAAHSLLSVLAEAARPSSGAGSASAVLRQGMTEAAFSFELCAEVLDSAVAVAAEALQIHADGADGEELGMAEDMASSAVRLIDGAMACTAATGVDPIVAGIPVRGVGATPLPLLPARARLSGISAALGNTALATAMTGEEPEALQFMASLRRPTRAIMALCGIVFRAWRVGAPGSCLESDTIVAAARQLVGPWADDIPVPAAVAECASRALRDNAGLLMRVAASAVASGAFALMRSSVTDAGTESAMGSDAEASSTLSSLVRAVAVAADSNGDSVFLDIPTASLSAGAFAHSPEHHELRAQLEVATRSLASLGGLWETSPACLSVTGHMPSVSGLSRAETGDAPAYPGGSAPFSGASSSVHVTAMLDEIEVAGALQATGVGEKGESVHAGSVASPLASVSGLRRLLSGMITTFCQRVSHRALEDAILTEADGLTDPALARASLVALIDGFRIVAPVAAAALSATVSRVRRHRAANAGADPPAREVVRALLQLQMVGCCRAVSVMVTALARLWRVPLLAEGVLPRLLLLLRELSAFQANVITPAVRSRPTGAVPASTAASAAASSVTSAAGSGIVMPAAKWLSQLHRSAAWTATRMASVLVSGPLLGRREQALQLWLRAPPFSKGLDGGSESSHAEAPTSAVASTAGRSGTAVASAFDQAPVSAGSSIGSSRRGVHEASPLAEALDAAGGSFRDIGDTSTVLPRPRRFQQWMPFVATSAEIGRSGVAAALSGQDSAEMDGNMSGPALLGGVGAAGDPAANGSGVLLARRCLGPAVANEWLGDWHACGLLPSTPDAVQQGIAAAASVAGYAGDAGAGSREADDMIAAALAGALGSGARDSKAATPTESHRLLSAKECVEMANGTVGDWFRQVMPLKKPDKRNRWRNKANDRLIIAAMLRHGGVWVQADALAVQRGRISKKASGQSSCCAATWALVGQVDNIQQALRNLRDDDRGEAAAALQERARFLVQLQPALTILDPNDATERAGSEAAVKAAHEAATAFARAATGRGSLAEPIVGGPGAGGAVAAGRAASPGRLAAAWGDGADGAGGNLAFQPRAGGAQGEGGGLRPPSWHASVRRALAGGIDPCSRATAKALRGEPAAPAGGGAAAHLTAIVGRAVAEYLLNGAAAMPDTLKALFRLRAVRATQRATGLAALDALVRLILMPAHPDVDAADAAAGRPPRAGVPLSIAAGNATRDAVAVILPSLSGAFSYEWSALGALHPDPAAVGGDDDDAAMSHAGNDADDDDTASLSDTASASDGGAGGAGRGELDAVMESLMGGEAAATGAGAGDSGGAQSVAVFGLAASAAGAGARRAFPPKLPGTPRGMTGPGRPGAAGAGGGAGGQRRLGLGRRGHRGAAGSSVTASFVSVATAAHRRGHAGDMDGGASVAATASGDDWWIASVPALLGASSSLSLGEASASLTGAASGTHPLAQLSGAPLQLQAAVRGSFVCLYRTITDLVRLAAVAAPAVPLSAGCGAMHGAGGAPVDVDDVLVWDLGEDEALRGARLGTSDTGGTVARRAIASQRAVWQRGFSRRRLLRQIASAALAAWTFTARAEDGVLPLATGLWQVLGDLAGLGADIRDACEIERHWSAATAPVSERRTSGATLMDTSAVPTDPVAGCMWSLWRVRGMLLEGSLPKRRAGLLLLRIAKAMAAGKHGRGHTSWPHWEKLIQPLPAMLATTTVSDMLETLADMYSGPDAPGSSSAHSRGPHSVEGQFNPALAAAHSSLNAGLNSASSAQGGAAPGALSPMAELEADWSSDPDEGDGAVDESGGSSGAGGSRFSDERPSRARKPLALAAPKGLLGDLAETGALARQAAALRSMLLIRGICEQCGDHSLAGAGSGSAGLGGADGAGMAADDSAAFPQENAAGDAGAVGGAASAALRAPRGDELHRARWAQRCMRGFGASLVLRIAAAETLCGELQRASGVLLTADPAGAVSTAGASAVTRADAAPPLGRRPTAASWDMLEPVELERRCAGALHTLALSAKSTAGAAILGSKRTVALLLQWLPMPSAGSAWDNGGDVASCSPRCRRLAAMALGSLGGTMPPSRLDEALQWASMSAAATGEDSSAALSSQGDTGRAAIAAGVSARDLKLRPGSLLASKLMEMAGAAICGSMEHRATLSSMEGAAANGSALVRAGSLGSLSSSDGGTAVADIGPGRSQQELSGAVLTTLSELSRASDAWRTAIWRAVAAALSRVAPALRRVSDADTVEASRSTAIGAAAASSSAPASGRATGATPAERILLGSAALEALQTTGCHPLDVFRAAAGAALIGGVRDTVRVGARVHLDGDDAGAEGTGVVVALGRTLYAHLRQAEAISGQLQPSAFGLASDDDAEPMEGEDAESLGLLGPGAGMATVVLFTEVADAESGNGSGVSIGEGVRLIPSDLVVVPVAALQVLPPLLSPPAVPLRAMHHAATAMELTLEGDELGALTAREAVGTRAPPNSLGRVSSMPIDDAAAGGADTGSSDPCEVYDEDEHTGPAGGAPGGVGELWTSMDTAASSSVAASEDPTEEGETEDDEDGASAAWGAKGTGWGSADFDSTAGWSAAPAPTPASAAASAKAEAKRGKSKQRSGSATRSRAGSDASSRSGSAARSRPGSNSKSRLPGTAGKGTGKGTGKGAGQAAAGKPPRASAGAGRVDARVSQPPLAARIVRALAPALRLPKVDLYASPDGFGSNAKLQALSWFVQLQALAIRAIPALLETRQAAPLLLQCVAAEAAGRPDSFAGPVLQPLLGAALRPLSTSVLVSGKDLRARGRTLHRCLLEADQRGGSMLFAPRGLSLGGFTDDEDPTVKSSAQNLLAGTSLVAREASRLAVALALASLSGKRLEDVVEASERAEAQAEAVTGSGGVLDNEAAAAEALAAERGGAAVPSASSRSASFSGGATRGMSSASRMLRQANNLAGVLGVPQRVCLAAFELMGGGEAEAADWLLNGQASPYVEDSKVASLMEFDSPSNGVFKGDLSAVDVGEDAVGADGAGTGSAAMSAQQAALLTAEVAEMRASKRSIDPQQGASSTDLLAASGRSRRGSLGAGSLRRVLPSASTTMLGAIAEAGGAGGDEEEAAAVARSRAAQGISMTTAIVPADWHAAAKPARPSPAGAGLWLGAAASQSCGPGLFDAESPELGVVVGGRALSGLHATAAPSHHKAAANLSFWSAETGCRIVVGVLGGTTARTIRGSSPRTASAAAGSQILLPVTKPAVVAGAPILSRDAAMAALAVTEAQLCVVESRRALAMLMRAYQAAAPPGSPTRLPLTARDTLRLFRVINASSSARSKLFNPATSSPAGNRAAGAAGPANSSDDATLEELAATLTVALRQQLMGPEAAGAGSTLAAATTPVGSKRSLAASAIGWATSQTGSMGSVMAGLGRSVAAVAGAGKTKAKKSNGTSRSPGTDDGLALGLIGEIARNVAGGDVETPSTARAKPEPSEAIVLQSLHGFPVNVSWASDVVVPGAKALVVQFDSRCAIPPSAQVEVVQPQGALAIPLRPIKGSASSDAAVFEPLVVQSDTVRMQSAYFPAEERLASVGEDSRFWGWRVRVTPVLRLTTGDGEEEDSASASFQFGSFLWAFVTRACPEVAASGALHSTHVVHALITHLAKPRRKYKDRAISMLAQLLATPELLESGSSGPRDALKQLGNTMLSAVTAEVNRRGDGVEYPSGLLQALQLAVLAKRASGICFKSDVDMLTLSPPMAELRAKKHHCLAMVNWPPEGLDRRLAWLIGIASALRHGWPLPSKFMVSVFLAAKGRAFTRSSASDREQKQLAEAQLAMTRWTTMQDQQLARFLVRCASKRDVDQLDVTAAHVQAVASDASVISEFPLLLPHQAERVCGTLGFGLQVRAMAVVLLNKLLAVAIPYIELDAITSAASDVSEIDDDKDRQEAGGDGAAGAADSGAAAAASAAASSAATAASAARADLSAEDEVHQRALASLGQSGREWTLGSHLRALSHMCLPACKLPLLHEALNSSQAPNTARHSDKVRLHQGMAMRNKDLFRSDPNRSECLLAQLTKEVHGWPDRCFRVGLDRGRLFPVVFLNYDSRGNTREEPGIDVGGLFRDTISTCVENAFDPETLGIFMEAPHPDEALGGKGVFVPNPSATSRPALMQYEMLGIIMGVAIRTKRPQDFKLSSYCWKRLLGRRPNLMDIRVFDTKFPASLTALIEKVKACAPEDEDEPIPDLIGKVPLSVRRTDGIPTVLPQPRSAGLPSALPANAPGCVCATRRCLLEHCRNAIEARAMEHERALDAMRRGIARVVPPAALRLLTWREFETLVCGENEIDVDRMRRHTRYLNDFSASTPCVRHFWRAFESFTQAERVMLIRFAWGRSRLPAPGEWKDSDKFIIGPIAKSSVRRTRGRALPLAHACFFQIELPEYESVEQCRDKMLTALHGSVGAITLA